MKKVVNLIAVLFVFQLFVYGQTLDERLKEIDDYANNVANTWKGPGMAIAIVKDDKVVFAKGYGQKRLGSSPSASYARLFQAVKSRNTEGIKAEMSRQTLEFAASLSGRQNVPVSKVYENGFTATTFSDALPPMRDERILGQFGALEVFNERDEKEKERVGRPGTGYAEVRSVPPGSVRGVSEDARRSRLERSSWEDLPFVFEDGDWKFAIGELFLGTFKSPGKYFSTREKEQKDILNSQANVKDNKRKSKVVALSAPIELPKLLESNLVNENTVFAIASNSKAFTTAGLAILVDEKKLAWDDKVSKYLPDFKLYDPWVTSELTIRDLVTHRVGLDTFSGDLLWYETDFSSDEILERVWHLKPVSSFRTRYGYQNLMFIAAGKVIERISGKSWSDFVTERILRPLGMDRTTTSIKSLPENSAFPHNESGGKLRMLNRGIVDGADAAAGLNSSVADLSKWIRLQLGRGKFEGKQIFSEAQSWQMWQPYLAQQISEPAWKNNPTRHFSGVAMGWFVNDYHGRKIINHSGGLDGMLSYTVLIPEENVGFVVLTNSEFPPFGVMMSKIRDVFVNAPKRDWNAEAVEQMNRSKATAELETKKADAARISNTKPTLAAAAYAGTYSDELYGAITIADESGRLVMRFSRSPNFVADLEHWNYDTFQIKWRPSVAYNFPRGFVTFTIDKEGKTDELKIDQPNNDFWFYELHPKRVK